MDGMGWLGSSAGFAAWVWGRKSPSDFEKLSSQLLNNISFESDQLENYDEAQLNKRLRLSHAEEFNILGLTKINTREYRKSLGYFSHAAQMDPQTTVYLENCMFAYSCMSQHKKALSFLKNSKTEKKKEPSIMAWKAHHLIQVGRADEAMTIYNKLFDSGYHDNNDLLVTYARLIAERNDWQRFDTVFDAYYKNNESLAICNTLIANNYNSARVYYLKGVAEYGLGWYRRAKISFEKTLKLSPEDQNTQDYLKNVSSSLGEGNNSSVKQVVVPVPIPEELKNEINAVGKKKSKGEYGAQFRSIVTCIAFERKKGFWLIYPLELTEKTIVIAPAGTKINDIDSNKKQKASFASWSMKTNAKPNKHTTTLHCRFIPGFFKSNQYEEYRCLLEQAIRSIREDIRCRLEKK